MSKRGRPNNSAVLTHPPLAALRAFHIVKKFIAISTNDTVEAIQAFTNTRIPAQPWATVVHTLIPPSSCQVAADKLIEYFGPEDLKKVVGGEKWWQVRGLNGIEAEWVAMTSDWKKAKIVESLPDGEARARAAKYAKFNRRHERHRAHKVKSTARKGGKMAKAAMSNKNSAVHEDVQPPGADEAAEDPAFLDEDDDEEVDDEAQAQNGRPEESTVPVEELDRLRRTILYCHGGGYFFGSPNTHRYQIVRLARKMGGRAFVPNYRKAPGYPWPCPLQDCLAAWFYLTQPPPGAKHKPVSPKDIIVAGDSAGGGLCLALLGVLRDLNLAMPAGAVLISPWCDMTHSFPSVLQNTDTDIIPPYGFVFKPSTLWPVPAQVHDDDSPQRSVPQESKGKASVNGSNERSNEGNTSGTESTKPQSPSSPIPPAPTPLKSDAIKVDIADHPNEPIQLKEQIQLYATNDQLYHPLCSPVLQGSLGGLPPLYIIAGDGEVLRDEVIMLAHRAARPEKYKLPEHLLAKNARARETAARFDSQPTKVHLQVFDYQCHVLTLFSFTTAARYAYRAIASFCKYVTNAETKMVNPFPDLREEASANSSVFSGTLAEEARKIDVSNGPLTEEPEAMNGDAIGGNGRKVESGQTEANSDANGSSQRGDDDAATAPQASGDHSVTDGNGQIAARGSSSEADAGKSSNLLSGSWISVKPTRSKGSTSSVKAGVLGLTPSKGSSTGSINRAPQDMTQSRNRRPSHGLTLDEKRHKVTLGIENGYSGQVPLIRPEFQEHMIRERVDVRGAVRPMENESEMQAVKMYTEAPQSVGIIKEGPTQRYLEGRHIWDERYKRTAKKVEKRRKDNEEKAEAMLRRAAEDGLLNKKSTGQAVPYAADSKRPADWVENSNGISPIDIALLGETPPPSALVGRRDCDEALTLLRTTLHLKPTHSSMFSRKHQDEVDDMVGTSDGAPLPSTSEGQSPRKHQNMHGLNLWVKSMGMFGRKTRKNAYFSDTSKATDEEEASGLNENEVRPAAREPKEEVASPRPEEEAQPPLDAGRA